jgi:hypothetical protein
MAIQTSFSKRSGTRFSSTGIAATDVNILKAATYLLSADSIASTTFNT